VTEAAPKKEQRRKFQAIRGTRDLLPPDTALWNHVEETAHAVFATFGFGEIRPPIFEPTELFARAVGGDTDIVSKEMYSFKEGGFGDLQDMQESMDFVNAQKSPALMESYIKELEADLENGGLPKSSEIKMPFPPYGTSPGTSLLFLSLLKRALRRPLWKSSLNIKCSESPSRQDFSMLG